MPDVTFFRRATMPEDQAGVQAAIVDAVDSGKLERSRLEQAAARVLALAPRLGQLLPRFRELAGAELHLLLRPAQLAPGALGFLARGVRLLAEPLHGGGGGLALEKEHDRQHHRDDGYDERETDHSPLQEGAGEPSEKKLRVRAKAGRPPGQMVGAGPFSSS